MRRLLLHNTWNRSRAFATPVIIIGFLVIVSWAFDIEFIKRPIPGLVAMNPATAICFILSGVSLWLLTNRSQPQKRFDFGHISAFIVLAIALLKVGGILLEVDTYVDSVLFYDKLGKDLIGNISNRMAPNTAVAFLLTSAALLILNYITKGNQVPSQFIALGVGMLGMLSILGYLYQVKVFYGFLEYLPMAIHTAVSFLLLSLGIVFAQPRKGLMREFTSDYSGARTARMLIPAAICIPAILGFLRLYSAWKLSMSIELGSALLILSIIIVFLMLIWFSTRMLNREDALRKEAEEETQTVNQQLEAFSYSVAHDMRAPLRAINGYAQMLREDYENILDDEGKRIITMITTNSVQMGRLIDDLLAFSRLGRKEIQRSEVDLNELMEDVLSDVQKSTPHQAKIVVKKLHAVYGDYNLLHQVVHNLVANAVKYSSKREDPQVHISTKIDDKKLIFKIKDNGAGFDMKYADKLFGVFQRLHMQHEFEGTGVGLAIVHRIIAKHDGEIWAKGQVNQGATFYFSLPLNHHQL
ncbi:sensor histidine kinase [Marinoscillum sp.]|uniref:sensor histidine kinase n=1 Tax=Marinoscillum sp. TaxID=2024838 RepID=UPI003BAAB4CB